MSERRPPAALSAGDRARFARHLSLPEIGEAGQRRLRASAVLVAGAGGLGSAAAYYLAAAGVGTIGIIDDDRVEPSNLQRQILYGIADIGCPKVDRAAVRLAALDPDLRLRPVAARLDSGNAAALIAGYEFVVDATDNFPVRFVLADACHAAGIPCAHAGVRGFVGQAFTVLPGRSACFRCVFESPPPEDPGPPIGPLGALPGILGAIEAAEAIRCVLGIGRLLTDRVLRVDLLSMEFRAVAVRRRAGCPLCDPERDGRRS